MLVAVLAADASNAAITASPFGTNGAGGALNGQSLTFGVNGSVFELETYFAIAGDDLNGATPGISVALSSFGLPQELPVSFDYLFADNASDVWLTYRITNDSVAINASQFFVFIDATIGGEAILSDEYARTAGTVGMGPNDVLPDSWEIDEPGYAFGNIFANILWASLDNVNAVPQSRPEDVSLALGFDVGQLDTRDTLEVRLLISDDGSMANDFALRQLDTRLGDSLTLSGESRIIKHIRGDFNGDRVVDSADNRLWQTLYGVSVAEFTEADGNGDAKIDSADYTVWRDNCTSCGRVAGDFNGDGTRDGRDFDAWKSTFGSTSILNADGNGNGIVDAADYTVWRDNSGIRLLSASGISSLNTVPEPGAWCLVATGSTCLLWLREKKTATRNRLEP